jgi:hypothetical protein
MQPSSETVSTSAPRFCAMKAIDCLGVWPGRDIVILGAVESGAFHAGRWSHRNAAEIFFSMCDLIWPYLLNPPDLKGKAAFFDEIVIPRLNFASTSFS